MTNDKFRDAIELHFGDRTDIKTKEFLGQLMRKRYFHSVKGEAKQPTQKQLDAAWNYLKGRETYTITEETIAKKEEKAYIYPEKPIFLRLKGFKKRQVRSSTTGRILGWID